MVECFLESLWLHGAVSGYANRQSSQQATNHLWPEMR